MTVEEVWHDPPDGRVGRTRDLRAAENGRALLGDLQLDLTQRLRRSSGPAFQRGALTTLGQFWDEEWETRELARRPANTRANYGYSLGNWVRPYLGGLSLEEIVQRGTEIGHQWIDAMQRDEAGVATITYAISVAKSARPEPAVPRAHPTLGIRSLTTGELSQQRPKQGAPLGASLGVMARGKPLVSEIEALYRVRYR